MHCARPSSLRQKHRFDSLRRVSIENNFDMNPIRRVNVYIKIKVKSAFRYTI